MSTDPPERFADNWGYLRTELNWLDRVLMLAIARQRKDVKEIDRVAQSRADRATTHWWKGIVYLDEAAGYDEIRKPSGAAVNSVKANGVKPGYQQQLETRIRASQQQGIILGLPLLRDRLQLTVFEKNLILMGLAPEVNRHYARIYRYLQGEDPRTKTDLPTVDLVLRLLCRNDVEWRTARSRLLASSPLVRHHLLKLLPCANNTSLNYPLKLADALVNYLLAEQPTPQILNTLLEPSTLEPPTLEPPTTIALPPSYLLTEATATVDWTSLILPAPLLESLQALGQKIRYRAQVDETWGFGEKNNSPGVVVLLAGASGTGKTTASKAIAHSLQVPLTHVDLSLVNPEDDVRLLQEIRDQSPTVLLIQSAQLWLRRSVRLPEAEVQQFLTHRRQTPGITLFSVPLQSTVRLHWQRQIETTLAFPLPNQGDRLRLWKQAFPAQVPLGDIDWKLLAQQPLTGGEIGAIARQAALYLAASGEPGLAMPHLKQALNQQGKQKLK